MIRKYTADLKDFYKKIFDNDETLKEVLSRFDIENMNGDLSKFFYKVIRIFLENKEFELLFNTIGSSKEIYELEYNKQIKDFSYEKVSPFYKIQAVIFEDFDLYIPWSNSRYSSVYIQLVSSFIYGSVKNYFYENRKRFLPEYDWFLIENNENKKILIESFFREFDRFADVISYLIDLKDVEDAPEDKIAYISAVLGMKFDLEEDTTGYTNLPEGFYEIELFTPSKIRNLLKKIIDVYRSKGSIYSYELFFNAIGIEASLIETYFDRRLYWNSKKLNPDDQVNKETKENDISSFYYYLTPNNPTITFNPLAPTEKVKQKDLTSPKMENAFKFVIGNMAKGGYTLEDVLGYGDKEISETFTYFKTNVLLLRFRYYMAGEEEETIISPYHYSLLKEYVDMITPIYIKKYLPELEVIGATALEELDLLIKSSDGYVGFYDLDGKYKEFERSSGFTNRGLSSLSEFDLELSDSKESEIEESKKDKQISSTKEPFLLKFNRSSLFLEEEDLTFESLNGHLLNNIDFPWFPIIEDEELKVENGSFTLDYFSYNNPIVAVGIQNIGENSVSISLEETLGKTFTLGNDYVFGDDEGVIGQIGDLPDDE